MSVAQKDGIDRSSFVDQISYDDLYTRWERGNWRAMEVDFSQDKEDWAGLTEFEREAVRSGFDPAALRTAGTAAAGVQ